MENKIFVQVPKDAENCRGFTPGRIYEAERTHDERFLIINDDALRVSVWFKECSSINNLDWIVHEVVTHEPKPEFNFKMPNETKVIHETSNISERVYLAGQIANAFISGNRSRGTHVSNDDVCEKTIELTDQLLKQIYAPFQE